jgi:hypothetical protein
VLALGVKQKAELDKAIISHGRILHDATVISMAAGNGDVPSLGQINWQDTSASSLSEMLVSLSEAFGPNLIDNQIATALLTGIVAETSRFSNTKTTPKVMTMSAQLMAAGANQQLVISKLAPEVPKQIPPTKNKPPVADEKPKQPPKKSGVLNVAHLPTQEDSPEVEIAPNEISIDEQGNLLTAEELKSQENKKQKENNPLPPLSLPPSIQKTPADSPKPGPEPPPPPIQMPPPLPDSLSPPSAPQAMAPQIKSTVAALPTDLPGPHELLDPAGLSKNIGHSFSAATDSANAAWQDPYNSVPIDPINNPSGATPSNPLDSPNLPNNPNPTPMDEGQGQLKIVKPPEDMLTPIEELLKKEYPGANAAGTGAISLDNARNAVESALSSAPGNGIEPQVVPPDPPSTTPTFSPPNSIPAPPPPPPIPPPPFIPGINNPPSAPPKN